VRRGRRHPRGRTWGNSNRQRRRSTQYIPNWLREKIAKKKDWERKRLQEGRIKKKKNASWQLRKIGKKDRGTPFRHQKEKACKKKQSEIKNFKINEKVKGCQELKIGRKGAANSTVR